jgi:hypothetical protein
MSVYFLMKVVIRRKQIREAECYRDRLYKICYIIVTIKKGGVLMQVLLRNMQNVGNIFGSLLASHIVRNYELYHLRDHYYDTNTVRNSTS